MSRVLLTGAHGPLGRRILDALSRDPEVEQVFRADSVDLDALGSGPRVDTIIYLGSSDGPDLDGTGSSGVDVGAFQALLSAPIAETAKHLVVLSSALVYGAWPNNAVPLTEIEPLRPNPTLPYAVAKAEVERLALEWQYQTPNGANRTVTVLRPTIAVSEETTEWMGRSLWATGGIRPHDLEPPAQFVHLDDLAAAIELARRSCLDGVFNVAPEGWISPEQIRALSGPQPRLRLPEPAASFVAAVRWRLGWTSTPPEILPCTLHPWVVSSDRLRQAGWTPVFSNEEAFVAGVSVGPLGELSPRKRQELALAIVGVAIAGVGVAIWLAIRGQIKRLRAGVQAE